jgi:alpha-tubulin suppressor-like RCC1 family protein
VTAVGANVVEVTAGGSHTCARKSDGTLWCWGSGSNGQLGDGTALNRTLPVQVTVLGTSAVSVVGGGSHTCARKSDGTLWCWGWNAYGQVGDGTLVNKPSPVQVTALGTTTAGIAGGPLHTCAFKTDGTLYCWGYNQYGAVGDGSTVNQPSPLQVLPLGATVVEAKAGQYHSCARKSDGTMWCWGYNATGALGDGTLVSPRFVPVQAVALGATVAGISAGFFHGCARKTDGTLWCWGTNNNGQLGDGTLVDKPSPIQVAALGTSVGQVAAANDGTCARKTDGTLWCWGWGIYGRIGDGTTVSKSLPVTPLLACP